MAVVRVQAEPFEMGAEFAALAGGRTDIGGVGAFVGQVRDAADGRRIVAMTLEHYPGMTERAVSAIAAEAEARWSLLGCTVIHRVGRLLPGEPIVLVLAAAPHRAAALAATGFLIDWLKTRAPFWKKEEYADGASAWVEAREADDAAAARWQQLPA
ncbi:MAG: molybdenum cofactor biosynthesis protein MoaE [Alphaproteobacteria bacterium]|nr:molybdenum cofactor biosynthesis protein MoaE [Alphaproteobacteria bacterium]